MEYLYIIMHKIIAHFRHTHFKDIKQRKYSARYIIWYIEKEISAYILFFYSRS